MLNLYPLLLLLFAFGVVLGSAKPDVHKQCITGMGAKAGHGRLPTYTSHVASTQHKNVYVTKTKYSTYTPRPKRTTKIVTRTVVSTTTVPKRTDTCTITKKKYVTVTITAPTSTATKTELTTVTTISVVPTYIVPSPVGFVPVFDSLPSANAKREAVPAPKSPRGLPISPPKANSPAGKKLYPTAVTCYQITNSYRYSTVTRNEPYVRTTTCRAPTKTVTVTSTVTSYTGSRTPYASVTITKTYTHKKSVTVTPSTTVTETMTQTVVIPSGISTVYAICGAFSRNIAGGIDQNLIAAIDKVSSSPGTFGGNYADASDYPARCCNACAANPLCGFAGFLQSFGCYYYVGDSATCASGQAVEGVADYLAGTGGNDSGYFVMNGGCGKFTQSHDASIPP